MNDTLHARIMNIPADGCGTETNAAKAYAMGHRDARHAAAELALQAAAPSAGQPERWVGCQDCGQWKRIAPGNHHPRCMGCHGDSFNWGDERVSPPI